MPITPKDKEKITALFACAPAQPRLCFVKDIMASYGDKWTMYTVLLLGQHGTLRFNELRGSIRGISQRMLTVTLRSLEEDGIVSRKIYSEMPPRVEYVLTGAGESLLRQLLSLAGWASENLDAIVAARARYRRAQEKRVPG